MTHKSSDVFNGIKNFKTNHLNKESGTSHAVIRSMFTVADALHITN